MKERLLKASRELLKKAPKFDTPWDGKYFYIRSHSQGEVRFLEGKTGPKGFEEFDEVLAYLYKARPEADFDLVWDWIKIPPRPETTPPPPPESRIEKVTFRRGRGMTQRPCHD